MSIRVYGIAMVFIVGLGCCKCSSDKGEKTSQDASLPVEVLSAASGATRLEPSPSLTHVAVEIGGDWIVEQFSPDRGPVPPVLKVIHTATETPIASAQGWIASPVSDRGELLIAEEHREEYRYRIRRLGGDQATLALEPPDGIWLMRGVAFGDAARSFVVLGQPDPETLGPGVEYRERVWIASIDTARLQILATATQNLTGSLDKRSTHTRPVFAANPVRSELYLIELPAPDSTTWHVVCLDGDSLRQRWRTPIESPRPVGPSGERGRLRTAMLAVGGTGEQLAVIYGGQHAKESVHVETIFVLDTASGRKNGHITPPDALGPARHPRPVPGQPEVALLHVTVMRVGGDVFGGISVLNVDYRIVAREYSVSKPQIGDRYEAMRALQPQSLAVTPAGKALITPLWFSWAVKYEPGGPWPEEPQRPASLSGAERPEVAGFVAIPDGWHRKGRPRVDAVKAWRGLSDSSGREP